MYLENLIKNWNVLATCNLQTINGSWDPISTFCSSLTLLAVGDQIHNKVEWR